MNSSLILSILWIKLILRNLIALLLGGNSIEWLLILEKSKTKFFRIKLEAKLPENELLETKMVLFEDINGEA